MELHRGMFQPMFNDQKGASPERLDCLSWVGQLIMFPSGVISIVSPRRHRQSAPLWSIHIYLYLSMGFHGIPWDSMGFHGIPWDSMGMGLNCGTLQNDIWIIWTLQRAENLHCLSFFETFDLRTCFVSQRRALFSTSWHPKVVRTWKVWTFCLGNVLRNTTACAFSTSQLPKALQTWSVLRTLIWKSALCHKASTFFNISTS